MTESAPERLDDETERLMEYPPMTPSPDAELEKALNELTDQTWPICLESDCSHETCAETRKGYAAARSAVVALFASRLEMARLNDSDFWATVARDEHGFVRTQQEWGTLAGYARDLASRTLTPEEARFLIRVINDHAISHPPTSELFGKLFRISQRGK